MTPPCAARPRDAATLILLDRSGTHPAVLMGRRSAAHRFLPGRWVFPGGGLSRADFDAPAASQLAPEVVAALAPLSPRRARAFAVAAVRETLEETGLMLGAPAAPDLAALGYIARMVTPPHLPRRFDTRFFLADAARLAGRTPHDTRELEQLAWIALDRTAPLGLLLPTELVLAHLRATLASGAPTVLYRRFGRS